MLHWPVRPRLQAVSSPATATPGRLVCAPGGDYLAKTGTLTFAPGETTKTITIVVNGDTVAEPIESFFVNLSGASRVTIANGTGVGTILNDD